MRTRKQLKSSTTKPLAREPRPKRPFDIDLVLSRIRQAVDEMPKAALFELAADGFNSPFELVVACILSIRTRDEVTVPTARRLFAAARRPDEIAALTPPEIDALIHNATFHTAKAWQIHGIARRVVKDFNGQLPCDEATLLSFRGVGPKCASLVLGIACGQPRVGVDVHVHRVTNRWGYVDTQTPERTLSVLQENLPRDYWIELNALLVPFGKHICTGWRPKCSICPVLDMCQQVNVVTHR
ncbi:MAG: endonuclease III [Pirellulales bacterium]